MSLLIINFYFCLFQILRFYLSLSPSVYLSTSPSVLTSPLSHGTSSGSIANISKLLKVSNIKYFLDDRPSAGQRTYIEKRFPY